MNIITDGKTYVSIICSPTDMEKLSKVEMYMNLLVDKIATNVSKIYGIQIEMPPQFLYANNYAIFAYMTRQRDLLEEKNKDFYQRVEQRLYDGYVDYSEFINNDGVMEEDIQSQLDEKEYEIHGFTFRKYKLNTIGSIYVKIKNQIKAPAYAIKEKLEEATSEENPYQKNNENISGTKNEKEVQEAQKEVKENIQEVSEDSKDDKKQNKKQVKYVSNTEFIYYTIKLPYIIDLANIKDMQDQEVDLMIKYDQGEAVYALKVEDTIKSSLIMADFGDEISEHGWKLLEKDILQKFL